MHRGGQQPSPCASWLLLCWPVPDGHAPGPADGKATLWKHFENVRQPGAQVLQDPSQPDKTGCSKKKGAFRRRGVNKKNGLGAPELQEAMWTGSLN